ncbi:Gfo/Idh/MocA family oxidoreductase [Flavobacteriaceae bacterium F89]|uniref:Gfo/Idh/MocA family oxidoreductase n=1 Tax=Cerina litoralis TaxID=2874477 RepID=A0AAE3EWY4_9FLAO|nr:Gfo/Idh/MocA family oxidoreductase [Cerina litoralis]MCG2461808.1 Gfo/Idh/MocA family oxidoreductase [Cerina litoralis]
MDSRRSFTKKIGSLAAMSVIPVATPLNISAMLYPTKNNALKPMTIGIIGAENSHTAGYGKLFNADKAFPGMSVKYVWGETEEFARTAMEKGSIPHMVKDPNDMLGKIDALIVDHRHGKYHLEPAIPFIKAGIPTFIDKPFCYRVSEGKKFLALAEKLGTPVTSYSSIAQSYETFNIKKQLAGMEKINQVVRYGPAKLNSEYGGIFFYGAHLVQPLLYMFGDHVEKVQVQQNGENSSASLIFRDGMLATLIFTTKKYGWETYVETHNGIVQLKSTEPERTPGKNYVDMVTMFQTGVEPRSHSSIIHGVAVLEALEKSVASGQWEKVQS